MIDWESDESHVLINPAYPLNAQKNFNQLLETNTKWPGHLWLATSGSTVQKWVGISKQAVMASAQAVNEHLKSDATDCWALALPEFHVSGIGIKARAFLSQAKVAVFKDFVNQTKWHAAQFYQFLIRSHASLAALVPSQLFDLLQLNLFAPSNLRAIVIGGGHLNPELYQQAQEKGWNVLPSYGLTECCSQVATAVLENNCSKLKILPHVQIRQEPCGRIAIKSSALLTTYAYFTNESVDFLDPKEEGWFCTNDRGSITGNYLEVIGRIDDQIKVGGENVDLSRLEQLLQKIKVQKKISHRMTLLPLPDARLGQLLHLVIEGEKNYELEALIIQEFHKNVLPFERIRKTAWVADIPKSDLDKILRNDLKKLIYS